MSGGSRLAWALAALLLLAGGALLGWIGAHFFASSRDVPTVAVYNDWRLSCPAGTQPDHACVMEQVVSDAKSGQRVASLTVASFPSGGQVLVLTGPYNVMIGAGLGLAFGDAKPTVYPYLTCNQVGCVAQIRFDDTLRAQFRAFGKGRLVFANMNKQTVQVNFSLNGFKRADDMAREFASPYWWLGYSA